MKNSSIKSPKELKSKLELIEKLFQDKKYNESLAEIRDFELSQKGEQFSPQELFQFYYLKALVLRFTGSYQNALENGKRAMSLAKELNDNRKIAQIQYVQGLIYISLGGSKKCGDRD